MVLAVSAAIALALALMLLSTVVWGEDRGRPARDSFRVSWQPATNGVLPRIEGRVHNDSRFRVTNVRVEVEGLDGNGQPVGRKLAWALGDIEPGGESTFIVEDMRGAATYRFAVHSFDLVSEGP